MEPREPGGGGGGSASPDGSRRRENGVRRRVASSDGGWHENDVGRRQRARQQVPSSSVGPTYVASPEAALGFEEGAENFGRLPASKSKILRLGFKRWRLRLL
jgi:hypothetical protein